jgi:VRR-NUC domain
MLDSHEYRDAIKHNFHAKQGIQSSFVAWGVLDEELLDTALACIPGAHLRHYFERLLSNLPENRTGLPDLVQFWIDEHRYRMIEVKGPGDRLQDNQQRWMEFCMEQNLPVAICHVRWAASA